jgi:dipeptidyl aminopeptidase/acylaminoacyl peptidase
MRLPALALLVVPAALAAQGGYRQPPADIARILDAPPLPAVSVSPDRSTLLLVSRPGLPPISEVAAPEYRLAGARINPRTNGPSRAFGSTGLSFLAVAGGAARPVTLPAGTTIGGTSWSPRGDRVAFTVTTATAIHLWTADVATAQARRVADVALNAVSGFPCAWLSNDEWVCRTIPTSRGAAPVAPDVPDGPIVQETEGGRAERVATYQDLLKSEHDERLFEHYWTSQLARVTLAGQVTPIGAPGLHDTPSVSPDGRWLLVNTTHRPFSYQVPANYFPTRTAVWGLDGREARLVIDRPLIEQVPWGGDGAVPGPRSVTWRADAPATLVWAEALDGGDPNAKVAKRDKVVALPAPFGGAPVALAETEFRYRGIQWARGDLALLTESNSKARMARTWIVRPDGGAAPTLLWERSTEDRYADPGQFVTSVNAAGRAVLHLSADGKAAFLSGAGASPDGDRPFLRRIDLASKRSTELFRSEAPYYEEVVALLDQNGTRLLTRRESKTEPANYWRRDLVRRIAPVALTTFADPAPQFAGVTSELITYRRDDGVMLSATLYLPPGYDKAKDGPLPFFLWAYPREFRSADAASQVQGSPYRFVRPGGASHLFLLLQGYGVLDDPTMPIVGKDGKEPNDTYVPQLVASAKAAVDEIVRRGVADRERIGIGGHSYGGFMTANLLAHSDLFKAGIARSGAYNRTLTPFGFQGEDRTYWEAEDIYMAMSPFNHADKLKEPILLVHGMADNNTGTFPIQSERMFAALKGNGGTARYVQLPAESHGYAARESVGHTLFETITWLDKHVKNAPARTRME